jgi:pilus assembly protein FimV
VQFPPMQPHGVARVPEGHPPLEPELEPELELAPELELDPEPELDPELELEPPSVGS